MLACSLKAGQKLARGWQVQVAGVAGQHQRRCEENSQLVEAQRSLLHRMPKSLACEVHWPFSRMGRHLPCSASWRPHSHLPSQPETKRRAAFKGLADACTHLERRLCAWARADEGRELVSQSSLTLAASRNLQAELTVDGQTRRQAVG